MKVLRDTCSFLWAVRGDEEMCAEAVTLFRDPANEVYLSSLSALEIALKHRLCKLPLSDAPARCVPRERERHGIEPLALAEADALLLDRLPPLHADPFDRLLICQAVQHGMTLRTPDAMIHRYPVPVCW